MGGSISIGGVFNHRSEIFSNFSWFSKSKNVEGLWECESRLRDRAHRDKQYGTLRRSILPFERAFEERYFVRREVEKLVDDGVDLALGFFDLGPSRVFTA
jgi:hypothetical protein